MLSSSDHRNLHLRHALPFKVMDCAVFPNTPAIAERNPTVSGTSTSCHKEADPDFTACSAVACLCPSQEDFKQCHEGKVKKRQMSHRPINANVSLLVN